ncbi:hypothetical protein [Limnobaculum parvum]|uniref:Uncharacterized protein n=1 Tax=Limnobaculum parvum TaxID=2172103 RepID=A0A2Y9U088_9GAMM|nr:hypothetical protein [Limnobaculum parvum]AWH89446.1 hypothetical protein HYN51_13330 [Limnobaculum parvum]
MSNNSDRINPASRALIAGALVGATASGVEQWRQYQRGEKTLEQATSKVLIDATKAGLVSGAAMTVANATAGRPVLTLLTLLSAGAAGLYLLDSINKRGTDETAE